jgi:hypothetical protein
LGSWKGPYRDWLARYTTALDGSDDWNHVSSTESYEECEGNPWVELDPKQGFGTLVKHLLVSVDPLFHF